MNILILEDEPYAALQLQEMLSTHFENAVFLPVLDSVSAAREYLVTGEKPDLVFLDINLSDGQSFEVFDRLDTTVPVVFLTAYDQYAIRAFELNSVDYLLKPLQKEKLAEAVNKYKRLYTEPVQSRDLIALLGALQQQKTPTLLRKSFLIPYRDRLIPVNVSDIAWLELENTIVYCVLFDKTRYAMEERSIEEAAETLDGSAFFRANRQFLVSRKAVQSMQYTGTGQLMLRVLPNTGSKILISRVKAPQFKNWIKEGTPR